MLSSLQLPFPPLDLAPPTKTPTVLRRPRPHPLARSRRGESSAGGGPSLFSALPASQAEASVGTRRTREEEEEEEEEEESWNSPSPLPPGLDRESLPRHVAVIMDGNSRWARARGLPSSAGHQAGSHSLKEMVRLSCAWGIKVLTVYAFSSENWLRPRAEVDYLMMLFESVLKENMDESKRTGIRICIIGDCTKLSKPLQKLATEVEEMTRNNTRLNLVVAISYSGRSDIVQACRKIAEKVKHGQLEPGDVTESLIAQELETNCISKFPNPDLLIRTSGELRLSNFLLWESAYTELYFTKKHWPDFGEDDYAEALSSFQRRQRRFGQRTI